MTDIVPELFEKIEKEFKEKFETDDTIKRVYDLVQSGKANYEQVNEFASRTGEICSAVLQKYITSDTLPNGKMYYNIAERILRPRLANCHALVADVAANVQSDINKKLGIGIKGIKPTLNESRLSGIIEKITSAEQFEDVSWMLVEPIVNFVQAVADDAVRENAEFQYEAGLSPQVKRIVSGKCCDWCRNLAGTFKYGDEPQGVFARHDYCRCRVLYDDGNGNIKDVHNGRTGKVTRKTEKRIKKAKEAEAIRISEGQDTIRKRIVDGEYSTKLSHQQYLKHVEGTPQYNRYLETRKTPQSKIIISEREAQELIDKYSGTGLPRITNDVVRNIEFVTTNKTVGYYFEDDTWKATNRIAIHYGGKSTHIVPVKEVYKW